LPCTSVTPGISRLRERAEGLMRDFSGSLDDKKTSRGVFVTTARFTRGAEDYVRGIPKSIVLIDGRELMRLMVVHGVGVRHEPMFDGSTVDEDYFRTLAAGC
jgi:restriction system protein